MDAQFQTTIWAMILDARARRGPALDDLVRRYWEPIRAFARRRGFSEPDAEEIAQEVLANVCKSEFLERADASKGRFRALLLTVTRHAMGARRRHDTALKRGGGGTLFTHDREPQATPEEREDYDRLWAMHLLRSALARVRELNAGYADAIELHFFKDVSYRDIAVKLGKREHDIKNYIFQGKKRLRECLEQAIREYCSSTTEYRDELEELSQVPAMIEEERVLGLFRKLAQELQAGGGPRDDAAAIREAEIDPDRRVGSYLLLEEVGSGGSGRVYRAWQPVLKRHCAIKILIRENEAGHRRLVREAQIAAQLNHPCIVAVHEAGIHRGAPYIAMEFVEGPTLAQVRMTPRESLEFMRMIAEAIQFAHERGVIHRDLKPGNILLGSDGRPRITDFGLARYQEKGSTITASGVPAGTPAYMAPEAVSGGDPTVRTDVYGLGATLYSLLAGAAPHEGSSMVEVLSKIGSVDPVPLQSRNVTLHRDIVTIVEKAMARDPADRYPSARAIADDMGRYLEGRPIQGRPQSPFRRALRSLARNRLSWGLVALLLVASATAGQLLVEGDRFRTAVGERGERDRKIAAILDSAAVSLRRAEDAQYAEGATFHIVKTLADRCMAALQEAFALDPRHAAAHSMAGRAMALVNDYEQAVRHFSAALESESRLFSARYGRGNLYFARHRDAVRFKWKQVDVEGLRRRAFEDLRIAAEAGGQGWEGAYARAWVAFAERREDEALRLLDVARANDPTAFDLQLLTARVLSDLGRHREAADRCTAVLKMRPGTYRALCIQAQALEALEDYSAATSDFARALLYWSGSPDLWNSLAICHYRVRNYKDAIQAFDAAILLDANHVEARANRASAFLDTGDMDRAIADINVALGIEPDRIELLHNRCGIYQRKRCYPEAMADAETMVSRFPANPLSFTTRSRVHSLMKNPAAAEADADRALAMDPGFCEALLVKGNALCDAKRWEETIAIANRAMPVDRSGDAYALRGTARWHLDDKLAAKEDFRAAFRLNPVKYKVYQVFAEEK